MRRGRRWIAAAALGLAACATTRQDEQEAFRRSLQAYNEAYRWKNYERAASFLPPDLRAAFIAGYEEDDKSLHIEGYQVIEVKPVSEQAAEVRVRYRFYLLPSVTLETRTVTQHWALVRGRWLLEHEDDAIRPIDPSLAGDAAEPPLETDGFGGGGATVEVEVVGPDGEVVGRRRDGPESEE